MTLQVHIAPGHDVGYPWQGQAQGARGGERTAGGYYMNAAQQGEAPGRWFGRGAETLGFTAGQQVDREPYDAVYSQRHPRTGEQLGRRPGNYASKTMILGRLLAAEPHATAERVRELEREAERAERSAHPYTDVTLAFSKSVSGPPRVFRTAELSLFHAARCRFRYSSRASCGVRYPSPE
jgi:hypothetical protein